MTISELISALNRVSQVAGDVPVILRSVEGDVETEVKALTLSFDPRSGSTSSQIAVTHGSPPAPSLPAVAGDTAGELPPV
jgi:hypothetical protein